MKDVTREEVVAAAKEGLLAAVQCSKRHWIHNAKVESLDDASCKGYLCALCEHLGDMPCPLKPEGCTFVGMKSCCMTYETANAALKAGNLDEFHTAAYQLVGRLAKIEYDLMNPEKKEEPKKERIPYPLASISMRDGISSDMDRLILNLPNRYLSDECKDTVFSVLPNGSYGTSEDREKVAFGQLYGNSDVESQIFPTPEEKGGSYP